MSKLQNTEAEERRWAANIPRLRNAFGLTQADLAERAGILRSWMSEMENGKHPITLKTMRRIGVAVGMTTLQVLAFLDSEPL